MDNMLDYADWAAGFLGAALGWYFGKLDGLLYALLALSTVDYISGVMAAYNTHQLSSSKGFKGIAGKVMIFALVGASNIIDKLIFGQADTLRTAVIFFYIANESLSIIENAIRIGVPIPEIMQDKLMQLKGGNKDNKENKENQNNKAAERDVTLRETRENHVNNNIAHDNQE